MKKNLFIILILIFIIACKTVPDAGDSGDSGLHHVSIVLIGDGIVELDPPGGNYEDGTMVTLTAIPDSDNVFVGWRSPYLTDYNNPVTIKVTGPREIEAYFYSEAVNLYTLETIHNANLSLTLEPEPIYHTFNEFIFEEGTKVILEAHDTSCGSTFSHWEDDLTGSENPAQITMDSDKTITAVSAVAMHLYLNYDDTMGVVNLEPEGVFVSNEDSINEYEYKYPLNATVVLEASPNTDYSFVDWGGGLTGTENPVQITMDKEYTIDVNFQQN